MANRTHWRASAPDGTGFTETNPAIALERLLSATKCRKLWIIEGEKDGVFFRVAYSRDMPRSFTLSRKDAKAFIADQSTIPTLTAF